MLVPLSSAQNITLQTGQKIETQGVRRDGDMVMGKVQVGTGSGEVGYHLAQIAKVEFPEPAALKSASEFLVQGQPDKALAEINPVVAYYGPFKDVPGYSGQCMDRQRRRFAGAKRLGGRAYGVSPCAGVLSGRENFPSARTPGQRPRLSKAQR